MSLPDLVVKEEFEDAASQHLVQFLVASRMLINSKYLIKSESTKSVRKSHMLYCVFWKPTPITPVRAFKCCAVRDIVAMMTSCRELPM